ncbi:MAG: 50S ribosomal protein L22 [Flavobacterium sp.]|nr:50S ribosomal protein L22 [Flavobacterium sp.]
MITAKLNDYRQSPRKVRLVANLVKGKKIRDAKNALTFLIKRASKPLSNLLDSAVANASNNFNISADQLYVKEFRVDEGVVLKRRMPRARGMAYPIKKRTSHVFIQLDTIDNMPVKKSKVQSLKSKVEVKSKKASPKKLQATS